MKGLFLFWAGVRKVGIEKVQLSESFNLIQRRKSFQKSCPEVFQ